MKRKSRWKTTKRTRSGAPRPYLIGAALMVGVGLCSAQEEDTSNFEGGEETYNNWIELSFGGVIPKGSQAQAEESRQRSEGPLFGIEDLHLQRELAEWTILSLDARAVFDQEDYKFSLGVEKDETYFLRFKFKNFRKWSNGSGGFYPPTGAWYPLDDEALTLDRGEISFEAGLTLEDRPAVRFKYSHLYRDGQKNSTIWGSTHPLFSPLVRGLSPTFYDIDEQRDIFELDVTHQIKETTFGGGVRYEKGDLNNSLNISQWPGEPAIERKITDREGVDYDLFNVHAFSETWIKPKLLFSSGFMFANLDNDFTGSRIYGDDFDVNYAPNVLNGAGYTDLEGATRKHEYVLNLNLLALPLESLSIVPSVRVQKEDWDADSTAFSTSGTTVTGPLASNSDGDTLDVRERLDVRYTGITNWVLYARGEWTQGEGNLSERGGIYLGSPIQRETEDTRHFQKYSAGIRWYPARQANVDVGGYYKKNRYEYDHELDNTFNGVGSGNRYPAFLQMQDFETYDGNVRLTLRPIKNVTLVSRYEYQLSTIHTRPDSASGLGNVESSEMTSHILAQNISWAPGSQLYFQAGFNYVWSETKTPASDFTAAVLDAENNYWTVNFNSGIVLDEKTDLNLGYSYYRADNYTDYSDVGLPLGSGAEEHGVTATLIRRLSEKVRVMLRYGYFDYEDQLSGGNNNYSAHVLYSSLQYRF